MTPGEGVETSSYDVLNRMTEWRKMGGGPGPGPGGAPKIERSIYRGAEWHRFSQTANGATTQFLYDGDNVVADIQGGNIAALYVTPFLDQNVSMTIPTGLTNAGTYYYSQDGLGSVRTLTNTSGTVVNKYDYAAFGETYAPGTSVSVQQRYTYTGRELNPVSDLMYYRYRTYDSAVGRFEGRDPLGERGNGITPSFVQNKKTIATSPMYRKMICLVGELNRMGQADAANHVLRIVDSISDSKQPVNYCFSADPNLYEYALSRPQDYIDPYGEKGCARAMAKMALASLAATAACAGTKNPCACYAAIAALVLTTEEVLEACSDFDLDAEIEDIENTNLIEDIENVENTVDDQRIREIDAAVREGYMDADAGAAAKDDARRR